MELSFTEKLVFNDVETEDGFSVYKFKSYLKTNFVEKALFLYLKDSEIEKIYFSSNDYGTATWNRDAGFSEAHSWESEDDLKNNSTLARRYPAMLENGAVPVDYAKDTIIPDVLDSLLDPDFSKYINKTVQKENTVDMENWNSHIEKYKTLNTNFIDELKNREL